MASQSKSWRDIVDADYVPEETQAILDQLEETYPLNPSEHSDNIDRLHLLQLWVIGADSGGLLGDHDVMHVLHYLQDVDRWTP